MPCFTGIDNHLNFRITSFCCIFHYRAMLRGNQHGGRKYDDLQNWLEMISHENPSVLNRVGCSL